MSLGIALPNYGGLCWPCVVVGERGCGGLVVKKSSAREGRSCERDATDALVPKLILPSPDCVGHREQSGTFPTKTNNINLCHL